MDYEHSITDACECLLISLVLGRPGMVWAGGDQGGGRGVGGESRATAGSFWFSPIAPRLGRNWGGVSGWRCALLNHELGQARNGGTYSLLNDE